MHGAPSREQKIRNAVLLTFCDPLPAGSSLLRNLSHTEWTRLLPWLDRSGLALYFFHRLVQLELCHTLPANVQHRLERNLVDNHARTDDMVAESTSIHCAFEAAGLSYAALKGFSLCPVSVPRPELRSQLDLDFLIAKDDAPAGRVILEARGYRLRSISGRSWEFLANEVQRSSLEDLYKITRHRRVELHLETDGGTRGSLLGRLDVLCFRGLIYRSFRLSNCFWARACTSISTCARSFPVRRITSNFAGT